MDQGVATLQRRDFAFVVVDADDIVAHLSEADGCDEAYITGADNGNLICLTHEAGSALL